MESEKKNELYELVYYCCKLSALNILSEKKIPYVPTKIQSKILDLVLEYENNWTKEFSNIERNFFGTVTIENAEARFKDVCRHLHLYMTFIKPLSIMTMILTVFMQARRFSIYLYNQFNIDIPIEKWVVNMIKQCPRQGFGKVPMRDT